MGRSNSAEKNHVKKVPVFATHSLTKFINFYYESSKIIQVLNFLKNVICNFDLPKEHLLLLYVCWQGRWVTIHELSWKNTSVGIELRV